MVDPEFDLNRQIKAITAKRKKTDEDLRLIERLEWYGGLYTGTNGKAGPVVVQPTSKVRKCLINAARIFKQGKNVERALSFAELEIPLLHEGSKDIEKLFADNNFHSRMPVVVGGKRIMRVRPRFFPWAMSLSGLFIEDAGLNFEDLARIVEMAGVTEGIGDNRVNGYGRFTGKVEIAQ
jgi:hypothetical protein